MWDKHIEFVSNKLSRSLFLLRSLRPVANHETCMSAYFSLFHSHLSYGILAWGHSPHSSKIFGLQRKAIRIINSLHFRADVRIHFRNINVMTLPCVYIYKCLLWIHERQHCFELHSDVHDYNTRQASLIAPDFVRLTRSRYSRNFFAPRFYNKLPHQLRNLSHGNFKSKIKNILTQATFYSIDEYLGADLSPY